MSTKSTKAIDGLVASFRIKPEPDRTMFYRVKVFASEKSMKAYVKSRDFKASFGRNGIAMTSSWRVAGPNGRLSPELGEIVIPARWLTTEVVSHEVGHAACYWARQLGIDPLAVPTASVECDQERFCYGLGKMVRQFVNACYKAKLMG